jgi:hypothetical protein
MKKNLILKAALLTLVLGAQATVFACTVSITNDIANPVQVVEKEGKYSKIIMPGQTKQVGSTQFHANFYLFEQINDDFVLKYTVDQAACNLEQHQDISVTDIMNNTGNVVEFFTVTPASASANDKPCCHHH